MDIERQTFISEQKMKMPVMARSKHASAIKMSEIINGTITPMPHNSLSVAGGVDEMLHNVVKDENIDGVRYVTIQDDTYLLTYSSKDFDFI
jgi:hypothetical protein